ncbi:hypothetical protein GPA34_12460 [Listeria monocytogenes]|uniref:hypothetical protein n=1 Tax=Listeria monocytogenes TaxID=1639 RepID=UPI000E6C81CF|nr:hypothetical protein [Listeria monocytogenes]EAC2379303.1 hypothetical protein [Listeria monocytogenes]EAC7071891.1 hypothetical protein [Listeria monocytogenes]EAD8310221.1 hypothetical protein [Listeria monocytogenes]EAD9262758.1 hypothetical protein [Listeria monocytogenes]EAE1597008.1 hypothetical protein [Listeria monocytogenes]
MSFSNVKEEILDALSQVTKFPVKLSPENFVTAKNEVEVSSAFEELLRLKLIDGYIEDSTYDWYMVVYRLN